MKKAAQQTNIKIKTNNCEWAKKSEQQVRVPVFFVRFTELFFVMSFFSFVLKFNDFISLASSGAYDLFF